LGSRFKKKANPTKKAGAGRRNTDKREKDRNFFGDQEPRRVDGKKKAVRDVGQERTVTMVLANSRAGSLEKRRSETITKIPNNAEMRWEQKAHDATTS